MLRPPSHTQTIDAEPGSEIEGIVDEVFAGGSLVGLIAPRVPRSDAEAVTDAVAAVRNADVAVVVVGLTEEQETEFIDESTLRLPGR